MQRWAGMRDFAVYVTENAIFSKQELSACLSS